MSHIEALKSLTVEIPRCGGLNAMKLALIGKNKTFIAHPCCQQRIQHMWYHNIRIRNTVIGAVIPDNVKVDTLESHTY